MVPTIAMAIFMGVFPSVFLKPMEPSVARIIERVNGSQPARVANQPAVPVRAIPVAVAAAQAGSPVAAPVETVAGRPNADPATSAGAGRRARTTPSAANHE